MSDKMNREPVELINIPLAIEDASRRNPKGIAFELEDRRYTFEEAVSYSKLISSFLLSKGIKQGDRAAIFIECRPEWVIVYLGISFIGAVAVPIDIQLSKDEVNNLLKDSESKAIFVSEKGLKTLTPPILPLIRGGEGGVRGEPGVLIINIDSKDFPGILKCPPIASIPLIDPDDMASLIYTSGTTGRPKGVMLTHKNFLSNARSIQMTGIIDETDCTISLLPLHHSYSFMVNFLAPFLIGAKVVYQQSLKGPDILKTVLEKKVTGLIAVPQLFSMLRLRIIEEMRGKPFPINKLLPLILRVCGLIRDATGINPGKRIFSAVHKRFGKQFRFFVSGGAKLDIEVSEELEALGFAMLEGYGLTETSPVVSFNPPSRRKRGSVGLPLHGVEIKIIDPDSEGIGEIAVRGPNVMKGYYRNPEETAKVIREGWLYTGDIGYIDKDGYLYITGRTKEIIVLSSGKNIYPEEIEKHYLQSSLIKEICIMGIEKKPGISESLHAIVVPDIDYMRENRITNFNEALKWELNALSSRLPSYKRIMGYKVYKSPLPKTTLGKLKRYEVKNILSGKVIKEEVQIPEEDISLIESYTGMKVISCLERINEKKDIRLDNNLELDLGIDSLSRVELIVALSRAFSIELPDTFGTDIFTVRELILKMESFQKGIGEDTTGEISRKWEDLFKAEPPLKDREAIGFVQGPLARLFIIPLIGLLRILGKVFFRLEIEGIENMPVPPYIITPNHASYLDGFVVGIGVPVKSFMNLYFHGLQKYFTNSFTSWFAKLAHVIPIDPETYLKRALQISAYVLKEGKSLCIFPEGGRTYDGNFLPFKKGVGILSKELGIPLVPALIEGTFEALPRGALLPRFRKISVTFGIPIYPAKIDFSKKTESMDDYEWIVSELRKAISAMKK